MTEVGQDAAQAVINEAKNEIAKEHASKNKGALKALYKKQALAKTALANINREIEDAEQAIRRLDFY